MKKRGNRCDEKSRFEGREEDGEGRDRTKNGGEGKVRAGRVEQVER